MNYKHTQDFHGRVPVGPEPDFVETDFGRVIVYANERGNVVAQTANPRDPLSLQGCTFDIATEYSWDGAGTLSGPNYVLYKPDHVNTARANELRDMVHEAISELVHPYAAKHEQALAELAVKDIEKRLGEVSKRNSDLIDLIHSGDGREADAMFAPVKVDLPIGPVLVTLKNSSEFQVRGLGYAGTVNVDGKRAEYSAVIPIDENRSPYTRIRYPRDNSPQWWPDRTNDAMLARLRERLLKVYGHEIRKVVKGEMIAKAKAELEEGYKAYAELLAMRFHLEGKLTSLRIEEAPAPTM